MASSLWPPSSSEGRSWLDWKEAGRDHFINGNYAEALKSYQTSLEKAPRSDQAILLSNIVACRLRIPTDENKLQAIQDAKRCIQLNPEWSKAHVRLAEAYIAVSSTTAQQNNHSNDACNALQTALRIDPSNRKARKMLIEELRRRDRGTATAGAEFGRQHPTPTAPPEDLDDSRETTQNHSTTGTNHRPPPAAASSPSSPWWDEIQSWPVRCHDWYQAQPPSIQKVLQVALGFLILYLAMGGRFGMEQRSPTRGNYGVGNAYDQFRNQDRYNPPRGFHQQEQQRQPPSASPRYSFQSRDNSYYSSNNRQHYYDEPTSSRPRRRSTAPDLFDGSVLSMIILLFVAYVCHRNGINPFQALFMLNWMTGGRRYRRRGYGLGMMGMGYGMANGMGMFGGGGEWRREQRRRHGYWY